ncbi:uncharacterized protein YbbK (DUF523 family) [Alkalibaculum bacchi]|uniref:Uncharacterized protein YbbK (DUF523 family) n=1 Tax=Alkalibaculum bacchi TaxID=645887 RepID=A0A366I0A8_9FIRM|nr:DUF523 domain-containing protein [Alkalibaculum bacchi]RBP59971.1 uncharacterized protein YbbK (DUF523 family) [Alkalibaculum bacchi]
MILVSACLAGCNCKYNGKNNNVDQIQELVKANKAITVCPEVLGGLPTPRHPAEIQVKNGEIYVINKVGEDLTNEFLKGAEKTLEIARDLMPSKIILKSKSPSCGFGTIYDGTFTGTLKEGNGLTADLLYKNGFNIEEI